MISLRSLRNALWPPVTEILSPCGRARDASRAPRICLSSFLCSERSVDCHSRSCSCGCFDFNTPVAPPPKRPWSIVKSKPRAPRHTPSPLPPRALSFARRPRLVARAQWRWPGSEAICMMSKEEEEDNDTTVCLRVQYNSFEKRWAMVQVQIRRFFYCCCCCCYCCCCYCCCCCCSFGGAGGRALASFCMSAGIMLTIFRTRTKPVRPFLPSSWNWTLPWTREKSVWSRPCAHAMRNAFT